MPPDGPAGLEIPRSAPVDPTLPAVPRRAVTVVTCMDARLDPLPMLGLAPGDAHVLRNAGGLVTDDVLRSLVLSQRALGTRQVIVVQHTDCGLSKVDDEQFLATLETDTGSRPGWRPGGFHDVTASVRASLATLRACPWLVTPAARGLVVDVTTGTLTDVEA